MSDRGIAIIDIGATNSKVILFGADLKEVDKRVAPTVHVDEAPYKHLDVDALMTFIRNSLIEFDQKLAIDKISVSAFGATVACLDDEGSLALPIMDYLAEPPSEIDEAYEKVAPPFAEVFSNTSPSALTLGKQLFWLETAFSEEFSRVTSIVPFSAFIGHELGGTPAMEISNLGVFTHLIDVESNTYSSLVKAQGWDKKFPAIKRAWDRIGSFQPEGFNGTGDILCGIHDSNANWLRYLSGHSGAFTLLSTGTFVIGFDSETELSRLDPNTDVFSFTDIFGNPVACSRFYGGYEFNQLLDGIDPTAATEEAIGRLIADQVFALPAFSDTGGPIADCGNKGRIVGPFVETPENRASVATLYIALMVDAQLDSLQSKGDIVIDGPFAQNKLLCGLLGQLRPGQKILTSELRDGTVMGALVLSQMDNDGNMPSLPIGMIQQEVGQLVDILNYRAQWRATLEDRDEQ